MKTTSKLINMTPSMAAELLKKVDSEHQRKFMPSVADRYAVAMSQGRFTPNNDAIIITDQDRCTNGQHRLHAVVKSGATVPMLVCHDFPESVEANGFGKLYTIDGMDRGRARAVGDQLVLRHGMTNGILWAGSANVIGKIACGINHISCDVHQAIAIIDLYREQLDFTMNNRSSEHGIKSAPVVAGIAFGMKSHPELKDFYLQVVNGENLRKGMPAYALRRQLQRYHQVRGGKNQNQMMFLVLMAADHFIEGGELKLLKVSNIGRDFFVLKQKATVRKVQEILFGK